MKCVEHTFPFFGRRYGKDHVKYQKKDLKEGKTVENFD
jgi:hypothetical protein